MINKKILFFMPMDGLALNKIKILRNNRMRSQIGHKTIWNIKNLSKIIKQYIPYIPLNVYN